MVSITSAVNHKLLIDHTFLPSGYYFDASGLIVAASVLTIIATVTL